MSSQGREYMGKVVAGRRGGQGCGWQTGWSHIYMRINWEENLGSKTDCATQGSSTGKESLKTSGCKKPIGVEAAGETPSLTGELVGETHMVLECTQIYPPTNQHQRAQAACEQWGK